MISTDDILTITSDAKLQYDHENQKVCDIRKRIKRLRKNKDAIHKALSISQHIAESIQAQAHEKISRVVARCLETVFDEPYEFQIIFEQKRNRTEARLIFNRDGVEIDPLSASGGGVVDTAAFALRIACMMIMKPAPRRLLIMDEPFKFVSEQYHNRIAQMLQDLSDDMGVQMIMVTHIEALKTGHVVSI
jgi:DNA repair exonuclease SbcCD ATPase subunit